MASFLNEDGNQVYKIRSGTTDSGKAYETNLIGLFALRFVSFQTQDVWFATNADGCGDFDDVIIYCKTIDTEDLFMVQCKHSETKKTITQKEFLKPKNFKQNNFSLEKYSNSSFGTSSGPKWIICDTVRRLNEKLKFILFTNNDANASDILEEVNYEPLLILNTSGDVYKFNSEKVNELVVKEPSGLKINDDFLKKLVFFSNQAFNKNVSCFIFNQIREIICPHYVPDVAMKEIVQKYLRFINDWAHGQLGDHFLLTKTHITTKLTELLLDRYMFSFSNKNYELQESCKFDKWNSILLDKNITVVEMDDDDDNDANAVVFDFLYNYIHYKIRNYTENLCSLMEWETGFSQEVQNKFYQTADKLLKNETLRTIGNMGTITLFHLYKALWKIKRIPLVLEVSNAEDYKNIFHILKLTEYQLKVIILNKSSCKLPHIEEALTIFTNLTDLDDEKHRLVLEETMQLQGRPIKIQQLIEMHEALKKFITTKDIINIFANNNGFNIGNSFKELPKYHIIRTIPKLLVNMTRLKRIISHSSDIFEVYCKNQQYQLHSDRFIPNKNVERIQQKNVNFHKLVVDNLNDIHLQWVESTGNTEAIKSILSTEPETETHEEIKPISLTHALTYFTHKINVISAHPGMGKSTAMNFLAWNAPVDKWILRINLNEYFDYYESKDFEKSHSDPLKHLIYFNKQILIKQKRNRPLDIEVFTLFLNKKSLIIQLDGFDEISPYYKEGVTKMIKSLCTTEFQIWLTTRPVLKSYIEQTFDTIAVTLNPLTEDDEINFLTKYYEEALDQIGYTEEIRLFSEKLLNLVNNKIKNRKEILSEIPLHTLLLAEVYTYACKSFINELVFNVGEDFDVLHLYERFTQRKLEILSEKYGNYAKQVQFETYQYLCALKVLFPEKKLKDLEINEQLSSFAKLLPNITELVQKDGIIVAENETNMSFTHRTFAEYFSAKWLSMNLENPSTKSIIKTLFNEEFYLVRNIFDRILAKNCPLHVAIIDGQIAKAKDLIKTNPELLNAEDAGGRLPIHLAASYGNQYPMPGKKDLAHSSKHHIKREVIIDDDSIKVIWDNKTKDILVDLCLNTEALHKDKILGFTALDYAIAGNCLANVNVIISSLKNSISISLRNHQIKPYLYYCARYGYNSLIEVVLPYIVHINVKIENDALDVTPFPKNVRHKLLHNIAICYNAATAAIKPDVVHINSEIDKHGRTALHWAASAEDLYYTSTRKKFCTSRRVYYSLEKNSFDTVYLFLSCGADVKTKDKNGSTALHHAAAQVSTNVIALLLANGADINALNNFNETPLRRAVKFGSTSNVSFLLSRGANPHASSSIHDAALNGYTDVVSLLLDADVDVNAIIENGSTALHLAVIYNHITTVRLLISRGAVIRRRGRENAGMSILHYAAAQSNADFISQLLSDGSDINVKDCEGETALHHAVKERRHLDVVLLLLSKGAEVNTKDNKGKTVLHYASENHSTDIVSVLLHKGADIHARDEEDKIALHHAAKFKWRNGQSYCEDTASLLLSNGANVNATDKYGKTALHYGAEMCTGPVPLLFSNGADPAVRDLLGRTPLHYAAESFSTTTIYYLINCAAADPNVKDNFGKTALHYVIIDAPIIPNRQFSNDIVSVLSTAGADLNAKDNDSFTSLYRPIEEGYKNVVSFLISKGAAIHSKDKDEKTPLHYAFPKSPWLVPFLLLKGADINAVDKSGKNALYYAKKYGFKDTVKILINHGAKK